MAAKALTVVKADAVPWPERAARVLGAASLPPLPTPADEAFHFTNLRPISALKPHRDSDWELADVAAVLPVVDGPQVVVVNGRVVPQLTVLDGLKGASVRWDGVYPVPEVAEALAAYHAHQGGQVVEITADEGEVVLHVIQVLAGAQVPSGGTLKVRVAARAKLTLVEHLVGTADAAGWWNDHVALEVAAGGVLEQVLVQDLPLDAVLTRRQGGTFGSGAAYRAFTLQVGGRLARVASQFACAEEADIHHSGLALADDGQTHDTTLLLRHEDAGTASHIRQRNILRGKPGGKGAHAVFQGKFYVAQKAQKTDAYMLCESLLLAEGARVSAKPELEIYADDVKCSHGASTGRLQPEQLFYLAARGVPQAVAQRLLVAAFADALLDEAPAAAHALLSARVSRWLDGTPTVAPADDTVEMNTDWLED
ncbi:MAG: SufD family Fe-S cluster assembly protein [Pseudomonadaceae bacterium]|nr:SufD family Fe-S cluster assembly protein [Pseudomonadaceae bacterium]